MCEDKSDWEGYTKVGIKEVAENKIGDFEDVILVLDDMVSKLSKQITYCFTSGRHYNFQKNVVSYANSI